MEEFPPEQNTDYFEAFEQQIGRKCLSLGDVSLLEIDAFLPIIPTDFDKAEFLEVLKSLPNDGDANGFVQNPLRSNRNNALQAQLAMKQKELLSRHFSSKNILANDEKIAAHDEALSYLYEVKEQYLKYHPHLLANMGQSEEWQFYNFIQGRIQKRKDLGGVGMQRAIHITGDGNVVGNENTVNVNKPVVTSGATVAEFTALLGQLRGAVEGAGLDEKTARIVKADLDVVEGEVVDERPSGAIIQSKLKSIAEIAENAAAIGTAAVTLSPMVQNLIHLAQGLFK